MKDVNGLICILLVVLGGLICTIHKFLQRKGD